LFREEFASRLENPEGNGVIAAVDVGKGVAVAVAAALVERPRLWSAGLEAFNVAARPLKSIDVPLLSPIGVVALEEPGKSPSLSPRSAIAVGL